MINRKLVKFDIMQQKQQIFIIMFFVVPGVSSFSCNVFGILIVNNNPIKKKIPLIKNVSLMSFTIPAAAVPANHPNA